VTPFDDDAIEITRKTAPMFQILLPHFLVDFILYSLASTEFTLAP
jgi:hypothetical protein